MNACLKTKPQERLCSLAQVKEHAWFKDFDWKAVEDMSLSPLYVPAKGQNNFDKHNVNDYKY